MNLSVRNTSFNSAKQYRRQMNRSVITKGTSLLQNLAVVQNAPFFPVIWHLSWNRNLNYENYSTDHHN